MRDELPVGCAEKAKQTGTADTNDPMLQALRKARTSLLDELTVLGTEESQDLAVYGPEDPMAGVDPTDVFDDTLAHLGPDDPIRTALRVIRIALREIRASRLDD